MSEVPWLLSMLALGVTWGVLPGAALLCLLRVHLPTRIDRVLAAVALSVIWGGWTVFGLLLAGHYERWTAVALLGLPAGYLSVLAWRGDGRLRQLASRPELSAPQRGLLDRVVIAACAALIALAFVEALTSPPTWWDATIHWDKWAQDWGRRTHLYGYRYAYPQLLPMFCSLVYKLTGAADAVMPNSAFALHALHPLFGAVLLLALLRLADAFELPAWPLLLGTFGLRAMQKELTAGGADLLLTMLCAVAVALVLVGLNQAQGSSGRRAALAVLLFAGAITAKTTGALALGAIMALAVAQRLWPPSGGELPRLGKSALALACLPFLVSVPFYAWALYADLTVPIADLSPREINYPLVAMPGMLVKVATQLHEAGGPIGRVSSDLARIAVSYGVPNKLVAPLLGLALLAACAALVDRRARGLVIVVIAYVALWSYVFSYDLRNLLPAIPFLAVSMACGVRHLEPAAASGWRRALAVVLVLAWVVWPAGVVLAHLGKQASGLVRGQLSLAARLEALDSGTDARIKAHFPLHYEDYAFLKRTGLERRASHVYAASPLYRWLSQGGCFLCLVSWSNVRPDDLFVAGAVAGDYEPPVEPRNWTLVRSSPGGRTFVYDTQAKAVPLASLWVTGVNPPAVTHLGRQRLNVRFSGPQGLIVYNALLERPAPGATIIWQLVAEGKALDQRIRPVLLPYDPGVIDWERTSVVATQRRGRKLTYSGLVTLTGRSLSTNWRDGILIGATSDERGPKLSVRSFRLSVRAPSGPVAQPAGPPAT